MTAKISSLLTYGEDVEFKATILNHWQDPVLMKIKKVLKSQLEQKEASRERFADYQHPTWFAEQADHNGSIRTLKQILDILDFVKD